MYWFPFQSIMLYAADKIKCTEYHLQSFLKLFSMFKIMIFYDDTVGIQDVPEFFGIMCINCGQLLVIR